MPLLRLYLRVFLTLLTVLGGVAAASAQVQLETLTRGVIAVRGVDVNKTGLSLNSSQVYVGWRLLRTDPTGVSFNVYRTIGTGSPTLLTSSPLTSATDYIDTPSGFTQSLTYTVKPVVSGVEQSTGTGFFTLPANAPTQQFRDIPLQVPTQSVALPDSSNYTYTPNDGSAADLDGDGDYEIILKWDPSNSKDNSQSGYTGNVIIDAYKMDGTLLWRIDLGRNVRAGAHYTQFMVYDFDGDGRAEIACRTAPGAKAGDGAFVADPAKWQNAGGPARPTVDHNADYRNTAGYVLSGPEFLTIFNGLTGAELVSTNYIPYRDPDNNDSSPTTARINTIWGDNYGNRIDRFLAGVAYLDGQRPSLVMCRGYYTRTFLAAYDWRGGVLSRRWLFDSNNHSGYAGQGDHALSVADVDNDGKQEIIYGAMVVDDDGSPKHNTGNGHGDALHVSDMDPDRPGLEIFTIQERVDNQGAYARNANSGQVFWTKPTVAGSDEGPGRAMAVDVDPDNRGFECWVAGGGISGIFSVSTGMLLDITTAGGNNFSCNFAVYWDDDLYRELLDNNRIQKLNYSVSPKRWDRLLTGTGASANNGTKSNPTLSADLYGDWREEVVWRVGDNILRIFTTTIKAQNRFVTFMHDPQYRVAIAWQNTAYNQPPHPSFNPVFGLSAWPDTSGGNRSVTWAGDGSANAWANGGANNWRLSGSPTPFQLGDNVTFDNTGSASPAIALSSVLLPGNVVVNSSQNYTFGGSGLLDGNMTLTKSGTGTLFVLTNNSFNGAVTISGGTLQIGNGSTNGAIVSGNIVNNGVLVFNRSDNSTFPGNISGGGSFIKRGAGNLTISNTNTYTGGTVLDGGTLSVGNTGALGSGSLTLTSGNLHIGVSGVLGSNAMVMSGNVTVLHTGSSNSNFGGASAPVTGNGTLTITNSALLTLVSSLSNFNGTVALTTNQTLRFNSGGTNTNTGGTNATFNLGPSGGLAPRNTSTNNIGALIGGANSTLGAPTDSVGVTATYNIGGKNLTTTFQGVIPAVSGKAVVINKIGTGALTFSGGNNTYTGNTTVTTGTLRITGAHSNAAQYEVKSGATLDVTGVITTGTITVRAGGTLTGNGTLNAAVVNEGTILVNSGAGARLVINGSLNNSGVLRVTSMTGLTVNGTLTNSAAGFLDFTTAGGVAIGALSNFGAYADASSISVTSVVNPTPGVIQLSIQSYAGHNYQLQRTSSLTTPVWVDVGSAQAGTGGVLQFTDSGASSATPQFYRIQVSP